MGVVVGRVDTPGVARPVVSRVANPIQRRIPHVDVGRGHVDPRPQDVRAVREIALSHAPEQVEALIGGAIAIRAVAPGFGQRSRCSLVSSAVRLST